MEEARSLKETTTGDDEDNISITQGSRVLVEYKQVDYRGFMFVLHENYGLLMLRCTRKKNKGPHWQVPGGHIDETDFLNAAEKENNREKQLLLAGMVGSARELFEETGIDVRSQLERISPANLRTEAKFYKEGTTLLANEDKHRLFYVLTVTDQDFANAAGVGAMGTDTADCKYKHIKIKLSVEHSGFTFQKNPGMASEMLLLHSGGKVSEALRMALQVEPTRFGIAMQTIYVAENVQGPQGGGDAISPTSSTTSKQRRSKRDKDTSRQVFLPPLPEKKKNMFCCFDTCT